MPVPAIAESGGDCQWNGPSWPFATTITLNALANLLHQGPQRAITIGDDFRTCMIYARSHRLGLADGRRIAFVDENLNPLTGEWHARSRKIRKNTFHGRGDHYNLSGFAGLLITGLAGLRPRADSTVELHPLIPDGAWNWFRLEGVPYHGRSLTILRDRTGKRFKRGAGLRLFVDGRLAAHSDRLGRLKAKLR